MEATELPANTSVFHTTFWICGCQQTRTETGAVINTVLCTDHPHAAPDDTPMFIYAGPLFDTYGNRQFISFARPMTINGVRVGETKES